MKDLGSRWLKNKIEPASHITIEPDFVYAIVIKSSALEIWRALTDPVLTRQYWYDAAIDSDWHIGSPVLLKRDDGSSVGGALLEYKKPNRLSYEFSRSDEPPRNKPVTVTFDLIPTGGNTKLVVTSRNLLTIDLNDNPHVLYGLNNGWPMFMSSLKSLLETGSPIYLEDRA